MRKGDNRPWSDHLHGWLATTKSLAREVDHGMALRVRGSRLQGGTRKGQPVAASSQGVALAARTVTRG
ncbi:hypothetical protein B296_00036037 [Ensete ventricosum]|uniref:Uncharacterized protein n=1 Tax=Ensete ventricosum TaxID=4639 RepID=A0A426X5F2_ENSVE|nr:hypothetical protein B296_00036037 [Ensete ventricosum]